MKQAHIKFNKYFCIHSIKLCKRSMGINEKFRVCLIDHCVGNFHFFILRKTKKAYLLGGGRILNHYSTSNWLKSALLYDLCYFQLEHIIKIHLNFDCTKCKIILCFKMPFSLSAHVNLRVKNIHNLWSTHDFI